MYDVLMKNARTVLPEGVGTVDIAIVRGRIHAIGRLGGSAKEILDCSGLWVFPGFIDPHTHVHWPYLHESTRDNFTAATRAALFGGTTMLIDFALQREAGAIEALSARRGEIEGKIHCDVGLSLAITDPDEPSEEEWTQLASAVLAYKGYMIYRNRQMMLDDGQLLRLMHRSRQTRRLLTVHAENQALHDHFLLEAKSAGISGARAWARAKPPVIEEEAIRRAVWMARMVGIPLYVRHVSTAEGIAVIQKAANHQVVFGETCPQYLALDESLYDRPDGTLWIMSPPLRPPRHREALWGAAMGCDQVVVGSDHCLFEPEQKAHLPFDQVPNGIPGVETRAPVVWQGLRARGLADREAAVQLAELLSTRVARAFGLYPRKGVVGVNADADLVAFEPVSVKMSAETLHMGSSWSPFAETEGLGRVRHAVAGGRVKIRDGEWTDEPPSGRYVGS